MGCQETVQTLLERQISSRTEVVNPDGDVGFSEASVGNNYWTEGSKRSCDDRKGNTGERECTEKAEHEEEKKWQEQNISKGEHGAKADLGRFLFRRV